ncbi:MAG: SBBP repeat-containing protein [Verrucomicrobia subdivision 3 bacterium]|nr:SBBP repeat-containing protein [Limisphaerales bacterium]
MKRNFATDYNPQWSLIAGRIRRLLGAFFTELLLLSCLALQAQSAVEDWVRRYSSLGTGSRDYPAAVATDPAGNVVVAGSTDDGFTGPDILIIKYSATGVSLWTNRYNGPGDREDHVSDMAVDSSGNVFVAGWSVGIDANCDYATIKYSATGVALWTNSYNGTANTNDQAFAVAVDNNGNVFVTGRSPGTAGNWEYATLAYSGAGVPLWTNRSDGDFALNRVTVDGSGNVFVTGSLYADYTTIAYSGAGVALWTNRYDGAANADDVATALAVDNNGNVFVTGYSLRDYTTVAYSATGVPFWTNRYDGPYGDDRAYAVAVGSSGNVFVTGFTAVSGVAGSSDYATIAYSGTGVALWTNLFNGPANKSDLPSAIAVDSSGNVFVTGTSSGIQSADYATVAYSATGVALWTNLFDGPDISQDLAQAIAVDNSGNAFVTGSTVTIAYSGAGVALWTNRFDGPDISQSYARGIAVDSIGNVFVTGSSKTIAYSGAGVALWTNRSDGATAVAVDSGGNVFVTGIGLSGDFTTIAYSAAGVPLWTNRYERPDNSFEGHAAIAVDSSGNVFVTGSSGGPEGSDYVTLAYSSAGVPLWTSRYNGPANGHDFVAWLGSSPIAVGPDGAVYVTGSSDGDYGPGDPKDFATIKYVWHSHLAIQPLTASSSTVNLTLSGVANSFWSIERALKISGPWTNLGPSQISPNGQSLFQDPNPPARGAFYRATQP